MKIKYVIGLFLILLITACAQKQPTGQAVTVSEPTVEPTPAVQEIVEETPEITEAEETPKEEVAQTNEIRIVGKAGFEPMELSIKAGGTITLINTDKVSLLITIYKNDKFFQNTPLIKKGDKYELTLKDSGNYEYWSVAYGVKGKITVE